jgi:hypothetical protein
MDLNGVGARPHGALRAAAVIVLQLMDLIHRQLWQGTCGACFQGQGEALTGTLYRMEGPAIRPFPVMIWAQTLQPYACASFTNLANSRSVSSLKKMSAPWTQSCRTP